jgi:hypothetical protein
MAFQTDSVMTNAYEIRKKKKGNGSVDHNYIIIQF